MLSRLLIPGLLMCCGVSAAAEEPPLHQQIDELILARQTGPVAPPTDDATFLRRLSLDLRGCIPTRDEIEAFLQSDAADKRQQALDRFLSSSDYPRHMAVVFDLMLMERRGDKHVKTEEFRDYLQQAFAENRSYLELVREILSADGTDEKNRPAAAFYLEREVESHLLTRDVGRVFFGIDLQCAQCHDHPLIDDYHQPDYYGLQAFFVRSSLFQADKKQPAAIAEQATGEAEFKSVFTDREGMIGPLMPGGQELVAVTLKPTEQYEVAPAKNVRPIPTQSRLEQLADTVAESPSPAFDRNIVNRLWAHMFGRGLVHPVDLHHSDNPPTHPDVLDLLARRFAASNYDIRWLLRELALTQTYQRSFQLPELQPSIDEALARIDQARATSDQARQQAVEAEKKWEVLLEQFDAATAAAKPLREAETAANAKVAEALKARDAEQAKVNKRQADIAARQTQAGLLQKSVETTQAAAAALKDDQQLAAALATIQKQTAAHAAELEKQQTALAVEQAALTTAEQALAAASVAADAAIAARVPYEDMVRDLRSQLLAARQEAQELRTTANLAREDVAYLETLVGYGQTQQQIAALSQKLTEHQSAIDANTVAAAEAEKAFTARQSDVDAAQAAVTAQQKLVTEATAAHAAVQATHSKLTASITSAESAGAELPEDAGVTEAVTLLKTSLAKVDEQVTAAQSQVTAAKTQLEVMQATLATATATRDQSQQALTALRQQATTLNQQLADDTQTLATARATLEVTWEELIEQSTARGNVMGLTPLTPEQLGWSTLVSTGQLDRLRAAAIAKVDKETPVTEESAKDPAAVATRQAAIVKGLEESTKGPIATFVRLYGAASGQPQQDFFATADQSLFASNGGELRSWLTPGGGNLTERLVAQEDADQLARELYLTVLSRTPSTEEVADVGAYLAARPEQKSQAVQELAWGLLTSAEFRFRH